MSDPKIIIPDLAAIAEGQIGTEERAQHDNRGAAIQRYQEATDLSGTGWPWCAGFVDWCVARWLEQCAAGGFSLGQLQRPRTAAAFGLIGWARTQARQAVTVLDPRVAPRRGDLVVYTFSHCGIVTAPLAGGSFGAVEGNTDGDGGRDGHEVARRSRSLAKVRAFIRLPVPRPVTPAA